MRTTVHILLVDDSAADRALAKRELEQTLGSFSVEEVSNSSEFEACLNKQFDLAITEHQLGWIDGLRVLEAVKKSCPDCPVIMFTGSGDEELAVEGLHRGLDDYIPKQPKRYASLSASVLRSLKRQGERQALRAYEEERARITEALRVTERYAEIGRMAGVIAHEINNPLESVTNLLYLLGDSGRLDPDLQQYVTAAEAELVRVVHITTQTLSFYRDSIRPARTDVRLLFEELFSTYFQKMSDRIEARRELDAVQPVLGYSSQIRRVLSNLIANAIESMSETGGVLDIRLKESRKWNQPSVTGVRITIADTGVGIAPENRRRLFEAFFTTKGDKGTGLGLWVSYGIVLRHAGTIHFCTSTRPERHGTVFSVFFPHQHDFTVSQGALPF